MGVKAWTVDCRNGIVCLVFNPERCPVFTLNDDLRPSWQIPLATDTVLEVSN
jgi:hypothetical protein